MLDLCQCIGNLNMELVTNRKLSYWVSTCHFYQGRKTLTVDKLEHLKSQLDLTTYGDLISQLEELILKLEPLDSACSSRRSSISSHVGIHTFQRVLLYNEMFSIRLSSLTSRIPKLSVFPVFILEGRWWVSRGGFLSALGQLSEALLCVCLRAVFCFVIVYYILFENVYYVASGTS